jgi:transposase
VLRFYTQQHNYYCGIDLHARSMYVCILEQAGTKLVHKNLPTPPEAFWRLIAPYREDVVVAVECIFPWDWLSDLCARAGIAVVLGPALSMKAIHGGKAKNEKLDAPKIAVLLRGGMLPMAYGYPPERRAPRDLLRRRGPLRRKRAELLAPSQNTKSQYNLPEFGKELAYRGNRAGGEDHFPDPSGRKTIAMAVSLIAHYDKLLGEVELYITRTAKGHDAQSFSRVQSVPGIGQILALVLLSEIQDIARFPRVQACLSSGRLVKCAKESAGKRHGLSGKKLGTPQLQWAVAEAAVLSLRQNQPGKEYFAKLGRKSGQGTALTVLAQKLARAVDSRLPREQALALQRLVTASPLRAMGEPAAYLAPKG